MAWIHKAGEADHPVDPHYEVNGMPTYWTCHTCRMPVLLDGKTPPITQPAVKAKADAEPDLSAQP